MTINEVASKFGIKQDTLRYYERVGVSIETIVEYVRLYQEDSKNFEARWKLFRKERELLHSQIKKLEQALSLLDYTIFRYENAVKTGVLSWEENQINI